jgi:hypothetical protein
VHSISQVAQIRSPIIGSRHFTVKQFTPRAIPALHILDASGKAIAPPGQAWTGGADRSRLDASTWALKGDLKSDES